MAVALIFPLKLSTSTHISSPQNSVRNTRGLQPSFALKPTTRIPVQKYGKGSILCSARREKQTSAVAVPDTRISVIPSEEEVLPDPKRSDFPMPPDFFFGVASSAYQVEGAWDVDGRGESNWDHFTHNYIDKIDDKSTGDVACDMYNKFNEDIEKMKEMGIEAYRFSIAWSRILPDGTKNGGVNQKGVAYYNNLINGLIDNGIEPIVTLFHFDLPQALETKYGGFLSENIINDFKDYADVCFQQFGNRVKHWITVNEPWTFATNGYCLGKHAPGRGINGVVDGDPEREPYIVAHNLIRAHGVSAKLYKDKYQPLQRGKVGMTANSFYYFPYSESKKSQEAVERAMEFNLGWIVNPIITGDYPDSMKNILGDLLPKFNEVEKETIKGSYDFLGINYYTSRFAKDPEEEPVGEDSGDPSYFTHMKVDQMEKDVNNNAIGENHGPWIFVVPDGFRELLKYVKDNYQDPDIIITENGTSQIDHPEKEGKALPMETALDDHARIKYMKLHFEQLHHALKQDQVKVKGYFAWSLTDNFEWPNGHTERYGLIYIDYARGLARVPKKSAKWYTDFFKS